MRSIPRCTDVSVWYSAMKGNHTRFLNNALSRSTRAALVRTRIPLLLTLLPVLAISPVQALNNCSEFTDLRSRSNVNINVVMGQLRYSPSCIRIAVDQRVTFNANFGQHPLLGGTVSGGNATFDPQSPIGQHNSGSSPVVVTFTGTGEFPFYCDFHFTSGMMGSIQVDAAFFSDGFE